MSITMNAFEGPHAIEPLPAEPDTAWFDDALCAQVDPEMFFPEKGGSVNDPKSVCADCEVREQCLAYALANNMRHGIWGGLTDRERRRLATGVLTPREERDAKILSLKERGFDVESIAQTVETTSRTVHRVLRANREAPAVQLRAVG